MKYERIKLSFALVFSLCLAVLIGCSQDRGSESGVASGSASPGVETVDPAGSVESATEFAGEAAKAASDTMEDADEVVADAEEAIKEVSESVEESSKEAESSMKEAQGVMKELGQ